MKNLFCLMLAVASWGVIRAVSESDVMDGLKGFGSNCNPEPTEEDLKGIVWNLKDVPKSTKCFRRCLMDQMELLDNCKLVPEKLSGLTSMLYEGKDEETVEIANLCNTQVTCEDECEAAHDFAMCILDQFKAKGWELPEVEEES